MGCTPRPRQGFTRGASIAINRLPGQVAEWLKAHAWNACIGASLSRVRIPLCPPACSSLIQAETPTGERLEADVFPKVGDDDIAEIKPAKMLEVLRSRVWARNIPHT